MATSVGVEGLDLVDGVHAIVADDGAAFAAGIARLLTDDGPWSSMSAAARASVLATNGPEIGRGAFRDAIAEVMTRVPARIVPWGSGRPALPGEPPMALDAGAAARAAVRSAVPLRASIAVLGLSTAELGLDDVRLHQVADAADLSERHLEIAARPDRPSAHRG